LSILDVESFRGADCDTNHCVVVAVVRENWQQINKKHRSLVGSDLI